MISFGVMVNLLRSHLIEERKMVLFNIGLAEELFRLMSESESWIIISDRRMRVDV